MSQKNGQAILPLVKPYIKFRAFVKFADGKHRHFYGRETSVTPQQLLYKIVDRVQLDRLAGFADLVDMIETGYAAGKYATAEIFSRDEPAAPFNTLHRRYIAGQLDVEALNDPVITDVNQLYTLYPVIEQGNVRIASPAEIKILLKDIEKSKK